MAWSLKLMIVLMYLSEDDKENYLRCMSIPEAYLSRDEWNASVMRG